MKSSEDFVSEFLSQSQEVIRNVSVNEIEGIISILEQLKEGGRLFICGLGGSLANASHATNDFRKLCGLDAYCLTDNFSEFTAWINDSGWDSSLENIMKSSRFGSSDVLFVFSVGGGSSTPAVSKNLVFAARHAKERGGRVLSIVGRNGGEVKKLSDASVLIPNLYPDLVTPLVEGVTAILWHLLVSHPRMKKFSTKW